MFQGTKLQFKIDIPGWLSINLSLDFTIEQPPEQKTVIPHYRISNPDKPIPMVKKTVGTGGIPSDELPKTAEIIKVPPPQQSPSTIKDFLNPPLPTPEETYTLPAMPPIIPQKVETIIDITAAEKSYIGKTEDGKEIKIDQQHQKQMEAIGHDTSTWNTPEPYISGAGEIEVEINTYDAIQKIKNPDGIWTFAKPARSIREDEVLCLRDKDGNISYHKVKANKRMSIEFDTHKSIDNSGTAYICMRVTDIPF